MSRATAALVFVLVLSAPLLVLAQPFPMARAQGETEQKFSGVTPPGAYNFTQIVVNSPSIIGYATATDIAVETAFMSPAQLTLFSQTGDISNSVYNQTGTDNYDALLEVPGTYYLVVYNPGAQTAQLNALYIIDPDINLANSTTSVGLTIQMQPRELLTLPLHAETIGSPFQVNIVGASSQITKYGLFDNTTQQWVFQSPSETISNFTVVPTVSIGYNFSLPAGVYVMALENVSPNPEVVYFSYNIIPAFVNPYVLHFGPPSPTGIAAYGIFNNSGTITPYKITTDSIVGFAQIDQLSAIDNGTNLPEASLQENTVLQVNNSDGASFTYWPQNVLAFNTSGTPSVTYRDNVLNVTGDNAQLTNQSITGTGTTGGIVNGGIPQTYYGNYNSNYTYTYSLPQSWVLYSNETVQSGKGVLIQMGVRALNGPTPGKITWFDSIMVVDPSVASAAFVVNGKSYTPAGVELPIGTYYDAELVFGGGAGGQAARFQVNAKLALFYSDNATKPFPSVYTFGDDTAEAAFNINVSNTTDAALATAGTPYFGILTNSFNSSLPALIAQGESQGSGVAASTGLIVGGAIVAAIVIIGIALVLRRRAAHAQPVLVPAPLQAGARFCGVCGSPLDPDARFCANCGTAQPLDSAPNQGPPPNSI